MRYSDHTALFLSHASEDDAATSALEAWLLANGFTDIFVGRASEGIGGSEADGAFCDPHSNTPGDSNRSNER
jgi:hypothetical protein